MMAGRLLRKWPDPPAADNVPLEVGERSDDLAESRTWDTDFKIVVRPCAGAGKQVERPPGRDIPRGGDTRHSLRDLGGSPRFPEPDALRLGQCTSNHRSGSLVFVGAFDEFAVLELRAGADERDQVRRVHRAPA